MPGAIPHTRGDDAPNPKILTSPSPEPELTPGSSQPQEEPEQGEEEKEEGVFDPSEISKGNSRYITMYEVPDDLIVVYTLSDPRDLRIRYVGVTKNCKRRYMSHCNDPNRSIEAWVKDLNESGFDPLMTKLWESDEASSSRDALGQNIEQWWVGLLDDYGCDLLNRKVISYLWHMTKNDFGPA